MYNYLKYINGMDIGKSINERNIINLENKLKIKFPSEYKEFMLKMNGIEGAIGKNSYLVIWSIEEIYDLNETYGVNEFTPGLLYFGSDGAETAYAFDVRNALKIVEFPFDSINIDDAVFVADTFDEFIKIIYER